MPVELGLELVAAVGADALDAEGELRDDVFDEVDGIGLVVAAVTFRARMRVASSIAVYW